MFFGEMPKTWAWALGLLVVGVAHGCSSGPDPLPGSAESLNALGVEVLEAFTEGDLSRLEMVRLTQAEHNGVVWPQLPVARGENPYPVDIAWQNIELRNRRAVARLRGDLAPLAPMALEDVECRGATEEFGSFHVMTDCFTRFRSRGVLYEVQLFKDVLELGGGHKIFRLYDEEPRLVRKGD